jgi:hypothetical protein
MSVVQQAHFCGAAARAPQRNGSGDDCMGEIEPTPTEGCSSPTNELDCDIFDTQYESCR